MGLFSEYRLFFFVFWVWLVGFVDVIFFYFLFFI